MGYLKGLQLILACFVLATATTFSSADQAEIVLRKQSDLKGTMIRLGDIADISAGDPATMHNLATTPLLPAPRPGTTRFLHRSELKELLRSRGVNLQEVRVWGVEVVRLGESDQEKSGATHKKAKKLRVQPAPPVEKPTTPTYTAVILRRKLFKGDLIREEDLELRVEEVRPSSSALVSIKEALGMEARQNLSEGSTLLKNQIRKPLQVMRGETVAVFARTGRVTVKTFAISRQDGADGDLVQVESLDKKERYAAFVTGRRELEVFASGKTTEELASLSGNRR